MLNTKQNVEMNANFIRSNEQGVNDNNSRIKTALEETL
jgi:hypothetical protein